MTETAATDTTAPMTEGAASTADPKDVQPKPGAKSPDSDLKAEVDRLQATLRESRKWEQRAKENVDAAEKYRKLLDQLGGDPKSKEFSAEAAIADLNNKFEAAEKARLRSEVARTEGVDPDDFSGDTEDEMRASAQKYKTKLQARIDAALEAAQKGKPSAAASASEVTSNGKVAGPNQITSRDELKKMSTQEIVAATKDGRLDALMGNT